MIAAFTELLLRRSHCQSVFVGAHCERSPRCAAGPGGCCGFLIGLTDGVGKVRAPLCGPADVPSAAEVRSNFSRLARLTQPRRPPRCSGEPSSRAPLLVRGSVLSLCVHALRAEVCQNKDFCCAAGRNVLSLCQGGWKSSSEWRACMPPASHCSCAARLCCRALLARTAANCNICVAVYIHICCCLLRTEGLTL